MAHMNAARVLPEPVGAAMSTSRPALTAGQASACAGVGAAKFCSNHARTAGWKKSSGIIKPANKEFGTRPIYDR